MRRTLLLSSLLFALAPAGGRLAGGLASAQLNNVVEVEDTYNPTLRDADPVGVMPEVETTTAQHYSVSYAGTSLPVSRYTNEPTEVAQSDVAVTGAPRRYLSLGGGTNGLLHLRGAVGARLSQRDAIDFSAGLGGMSADVGRALQTDAPDWASRFYRATGQLTYSHRFSGTSVLSLRAEVENHAFNYSHDFPSRVAAGQTDKQRDLLGGVEARLTPLRLTGSDAREGGRGLLVGAAAAFRFFNQERPYLGADDDDSRGEEMQLDGEVQALYRFSARHAAGLLVRANHTGYAYDLLSDINYLQVRPHYDYTDGGLTLSLGAELAILGGQQWSNGTNTDDDLTVSPQVQVSYLLGSGARLFAEATGGIVRNDFRRLYSLTPYWRIDAPGSPYVQLPHEIDAVRARAGVEGTLARGLHASIAGGYELSAHRAEMLYDGEMLCADGTRLHVDAALRYDLRDYLHVRLRGTWNHWTTDAAEEISGVESLSGERLEDNLLAWRPIVDAALSVEGSPVARLRVGADLGAQIFSRADGLLYERPHTLMLSAEASYRLPVSAVEQGGGSLSVYARGLNLLSRQQDICPMVRMPGVGVMGGVRVSF